MCVLLCLALHNVWYKVPWPYSWRVCTQSRELWKTGRSVGTSIVRKWVRVDERSLQVGAVNCLQLILTASCPDLISFMPSLIPLVEFVGYHSLLSVRFREPWLLYAVLERGWPGHVSSDWCETWGMPQVSTRCVSHVIRTGVTEDATKSLEEVGMPYFYVPLLETLHFLSSVLLHCEGGGRSRPWAEHRHYHPSNTTRAEQTEK